MFKNHNIMFFQDHPAFKSADPALKAELLLYARYCFVSLSSLSRTSSMSQEYLNRLKTRITQLDAFASSIGPRQRRALLRRCAVMILLARRLMGLRGVYTVSRVNFHVNSVVSRSHFLLFKNAAETLFYEGSRLYREKRFAEAANRWTQAALIQHGPSHAFLSTMLFEGRKGVPSDETKAILFARAGTALNCPHSKGAFACCCLYQPGIIPNFYRDDGKRLELATESALTGSPFGLYVLAMIYSRGLGVPQNDAKAMELFGEAADAGHAASMCELAHRLREQGLYPDLKRIAGLLVQAADQGHPLAQCSLGLMFKHGEHFAVNYQRARECFQAATDQGNALGKGLLDILEKDMSKRR